MYADAAAVGGGRDAQDCAPYVHARRRIEPAETQPVKTEETFVRTDPEIPVGCLGNGVDGSARKAGLGAPSVPCVL